MIYSLAIFLYMLAVIVISPFHRKARTLVRGHIDTFRILRSKIDRNARYVWFHAASLGEFEQGRPVIEKIKSINKYNPIVTSVVTYGLFTEGIEKFEEFYKAGLLNGLYTTNLSYIPEEYKNCEWLHICDCSKQLASIIYNIHNDLSISEILRDKSHPVKLLEKKFREQN